MIVMNNCWGISTEHGSQHCVKNISDRGKPFGIKGEVVDVSCYSKNGVAKGTGAGHLKCAIDCAKEGKPLGLLTDGDASPGGILRALSWQGLVGRR